MTSNLYVLDHTGHGLMASWTTDTGHAEARKVFSDLQAKRYTMWKVDDTGDMAGGELIREFDPTAVEILATPQIVGG